MRDRGQETDIHMPRPDEHVCTEGDSLLQGKHLLFLMLVVVHLSTVGQLLVPRLEHNKGQRGHEKSLIFIHIYSHCSVDIHLAACASAAHVPVSWLIKNVVCVKNAKRGCIQNQKL